MLPVSKITPELLGHTKCFCWEQRHRKIPREYDYILVTINRVNRELKSRHITGNRFIGPSNGFIQEAPSALTSAMKIKLIYKYHPRFASRIFSRHEQA